MLETDRYGTVLDPVPVCVFMEKNVPLFIIVITVNGLDFHNNYVVFVDNFRNVGSLID